MDLVIWWTFLVEHSSAYYIVKREKGMFLQYGKYAMQQPKWNVCAFYNDFSEKWERIPD